MSAFDYWDDERQVRARLPFEDIYLEIVRNQYVQLTNDAFSVLTDGDIAKFIGRHCVARAMRRHIRSLGSYPPDPFTRRFELAGPITNADIAQADRLQDLALLWEKDE